MKELIAAGADVDAKEEFTSVPGIAENKRIHYIEGTNGCRKMWSSDHITRQSKSIILKLNIGFIPMIFVLLLFSSYGSRK